MMDNTKARPGEFDALEKARPDELIFTLLERDPDAPPAILFWVQRRRDRARAEIKDKDKLKAELMQCTEAEFIAMEMESRQRGGEAEAVDTRATYGGATVEKSIVEILLSKLRALMSEADYYAHEALEIVNEIRREGGTERLPHSLGDELAAAAATVHSLALDLSPHRAQYLAESELPLPDPA